MNSLFRPSSALAICSWVVLSFLVFPTLVVVPLSFGDPVQLIFPPVSWGTEIYQTLFRDDKWLNSAMLSARIALFSTVLAVATGLPAAYGLSRTTWVGRQSIYGLFMAPAVIPVVVLGLGLYLFFVKVSLVRTEIGIVLAHAVVAFPFVTSTLLAGIKMLDENLEKASHVMGAGTVYTFFHVVVPLLSRSIIAAALFSFLISFDETIVSYFIGNSADMTLPVRMYQSVRWDSTPVLAAVSTLLTLLSFTICLVATFALRAKPN